MAGVKGKSGGARQGAGRKPTPPEAVQTADASEFLRQVMQGLVIPSPAQLDAAKALHRGMATGKRANANEAAKAVSAGKFASSAPPKLVAVGGRKG